MKIAILVEGLPPKIIGGTEVATDIIARHLTRRGHDVHVLTFLDSGLPKESAERGFHVHPLTSPKIHLLGTALHLVKMLVVLKKINPSVIHAQNIHSGLFGFWVKKCLGSPYIVHGQGSDVYLPWRFKRPISRLVLTSADAVIALTEHMKREMQKTSNRSIHVIPTGVDPSRFEGVSKDHARDKLHLGQEAKVIIYVGRLCPIKGLEYLIKAMRLIKDEENDARLVLVGEGEERGHLEGLVSQLGLKECTTFTGKVPNEAVPEHMAAGNVFVLPSLSEGFPLVVLEAMAAGLPIVATNVGGIPEFIVNAENGFLVEPKDPEQIAEKVCLLLGDDELRRRISENNKEKARDYSWENIIDRLEHVYTDALANKSKMRNREEE
jgi:glycosyltransferase involved in cell wall biosynthesis